MFYAYNEELSNIILTRMKFGHDGKNYIGYDKNKKIYIKKNYVLFKSLRLVIKDKIPIFNSIYLQK